MPIFDSLNDVIFAAKSPSLIESEIIARAEKNLSTEDYALKLARADPRRLFLLAVVDMLSHQRSIIDYTGKMNLLAYADGEYLDHIGAMLGVKRLEPSAAMTTLRFTLSAPQSESAVIPAGTRATPDGNVFFAVTDDVHVPPHTKTIDVPARCNITGDIGNGWLPGQINAQVDRLLWIKDVENITESSGGADTEDDENLRKRIQIAPESFSVAGARGAYEYWALTANQNIIDVAVVGPPDIDPGEVELYPLMRDGAMPTQDILDAVLAICSAEDVRPLTDHVTAKTPQELKYDLNVTYWIDRANATGAPSIQQAVNAAADEWAVWQRSKLGRDINPSELVKRMVTAGAKRVEITSPKFTILTASQLASLNERGKTVTFGGLEDG